MRSFIVIVLAVSYAVIIATGILIVGLAVVASTKGYSLVQLYTETFSPFRGSGEIPTPPIVYSIFFAYVIGAAQIAIICRRRIARR